MIKLMHSTKVLLKPFVCGIIISSMLSSFNLYANALSNSKGPVGMYTANGITYNNYNNIITGKDVSNLKFATAMTTAAAKNVNTLNGGWAGAMPVLYNSSGTAVATGTWGYNSAGSTGIGLTVDYRGFTNSDSYYAQGLTRAWNGTDYWTYSTHKTPNMNDFTGA